MQNGGECYIGRDDANYTMYGKGPDSECGSILGGNWTNMVFKRPSKAELEWEYKGCFNERDERTIDIYLGNFPTIQ
jgi:hypothetical protein